jgi:hypothetical protein
VENQHQRNQDLTLSIYNAYNRHNACAVFFDAVKDKTTDRTIFPRPALIAVPFLQHLASGFGACAIN